MKAGEKEKEKFSNTRRDTRNSFRLADGSRHPSANEFPSKNSNKTSYCALDKINQVSYLAKANSSCGKQDIYKRQMKESQLRTNL